MNVVVGVAGTDECIRTLEQTIERTSAAGDELTVAVIEKEGAERTPAEMAAEANAMLADAGIEADTVELEGHPGTALVDYTERGEFDQVVIGGGELSPMGKIQLGPITEFVLLNAPTTVKLVR